MKNLTHYFSPSRNTDDYLISVCREEQWSQYNGTNATCVTLTLRSRFHKHDPDKLASFIRRKIHEYGCQFKNNFALRAWFEFTPTNHYLHLHGVLYGTQYKKAKFLAWWRKYFGFTKSKPPTDLSKWLTYCQKDSVEMPYKNILFTTQYVEKAFKRSATSPKAKLLGQAPKRSGGTCVKRNNYDLENIFSNI